MTQRRFCSGLPAVVPHMCAGEPQTLTDYTICPNIADVDISVIGRTVFRDSSKAFEVEVIDSCEDLVALYGTVFDLPRIRKFVARRDFSLVFDGLSGGTWLAHGNPPATSSQLTAAVNAWPVCIASRGGLRQGRVGGLAWSGRVEPAQVCAKGGAICVAGSQHGRAASLISPHHVARTLTVATQTQTWCTQQTW